MKSIYSILLIFLFMACETPKQVTVSSESSEEKDEASYSIGQVFLNDADCEVYIRLENSGMKLYPVGMDEMFKVNQAWLQFRFTFSRAPQPEGCGDARAAALTEIVRLKR